jgi:hypothetical protein
LAAQGIALSPAAIEGRLRVEASPELLRLNIHASGGEGTDALVTAAANVLVQRAEDEEARVAFGLIANLNQQADELVARLDELSTRRATILRREVAEAGGALASRAEINLIDNNVPLLANGGEAVADELRDLLSGLSQLLGDPELIAVDVEISSVQTELERITAEREEVLSSRVYSAPLSILNPTETVETESDPLPTRDLMVLGGIAGLVVGWAVVNLLDRIRKDRGGEAPAQLRVIGADAEDEDRLSTLIERTAEVERRARALATATGATNGRPAEHPATTGTRG